MTSGDEEGEEKLRKKFLKEAGLSGDLQRCARHAALNRAWATRNFEIELYWKRSLYFWGFQVAFFAIAGIPIGFLNKASFEVEPYLLLVAVIISCMGCLSASLWTMVERGSKSWQDNWERVIDLLEDEFEGAIYKTYIFSGKSDNKIVFSVSKINSLMTLSVAGLWFLLLGIFITSIVSRCFSISISSLFDLSLAIFVILVFAGLFVYLLAEKAKIEWRLTSDLTSTKQQKAYKTNRRFLKEK